MKILAIIPARFASTRFPGKPLELVDGISMVEQVYRRCEESKVFEKIIVATDDIRIEQAVLQFGGNVVQTNPNHPSGTDRCFEAYQKNGQVFDAIINVQGDEPFISSEAIQKVALLIQNKAQIATLAVQIQDIQTLLDVNKVKVVLSEMGNALYFSRASIPFQREASIENWLQNTAYFAHIGIYGFHVSVIESVQKLQESKLEKLECLEQLRWLENGFAIQVGVIADAPMGVDTPQDLRKINDLLAQGKI